MIMANTIEPISYIQLNDGLDPHPIDAVSIEGKLISDFQEAGKIVQTISASSTDEEIPSARCLYEMIYGSFNPPVHDYSKDYLTFEALEDTTFKFTRNALEYSVDDGNTWVNLPTDTNTPTVASGDKIMFKKVNPTISSSYGIGSFSSTGKFNVSGNIMSLLYGDDFDGQISLSGKNYVFARLFYNCKNVISASNLILPATTLTIYCYHSMFYFCASLVTAPELPATTLAGGCYASMFSYCRSLTVAPELPATTLVYSCYENMFYYCTSLTTAPELPATTLKNRCYGSMFSNCTSLATAPELPATTLAQSCYSSMFFDCSSLATAPELPATTLADQCYSGMFSNCTSLTTAPELPATTLADQCYYRMFYNTNIIPDCTNIDFLNDSVVGSGGLRGLFAGTKVTDQDLNNILPKNANNKYYLPKVANYCYSYMFKDCTSLTTAPELPVTTLANWCYDSMFSGCTSLTTVPELPATILAEGCYYGMFAGCTSLTTAPELPATTLARDCYGTMFSRCSSLATAPELPATTLADSCYESMFYNCTNLTKSPILPATNIDVYACYYNMFYGCTNLRYITCYAEGNYDTYNTEYWVYGVSERGTFKCKDDSIWTRGYDGIPQNWTTNIEVYDLFNSAGLYGMYIDDFLKANPNDFIEDSIGNDCNAYEYTGNTISYDGGDYYVWKNMGYATSINNNGSNKCYALTSTIDQNTLQQKSLEYSLSNLTEYPIYTYLYWDGNEYSSGQLYNIVSVSQTTGLEMWIDDDFDYGWQNAGYSNMEEYLNWYLNNIDEAGGRHYYYIDEFEYNGGTYYLWCCYIDNRYLLTDTNNVTTLTSYSIESNHSNVNTHPIITFLDKDLTEYGRPVSTYSIVKVTSSQPKQMIWVDDFMRDDIVIQDFINNPEVKGCNYYEYCEPFEYNNSTYYVWKYLGPDVLDDVAKYVLTDTIDLQTLQSYSLESSLSNIGTKPIVAYFSYDLQETYIATSRIDNIIKVFKL